VTTLQNKKQTFIQGNGQQSKQDDPYQCL